MHANAKSHATPMDPRFMWSLSFASGYLDLGMLGKAERELDILPPEYQDRPEVMTLRSRILVARRQWPRVIEHARRAVRLFPDATEYYVHAAMAYDMLGLPAKGRDIWHSAPPRVRSSAFFHLHLARCEARLGNAAGARDHLQRAFNLDPALRSVAGRDPQLAPLLPELGKN